MKKSLSKQILFLSLAALVVVSTGCERRGRAPAKPKQETKGDQQQNVAGDPTQTKPAPTDANTTVEKAPEDAKMDCSIALSSGEPTAESFTYDFNKVTEFFGCLKANGIALVSAMEGETLDSKIFITADNGKDFVGIKRIRTEDEKADVPSLRDTHEKLSKEEGSNDDLASRTLEARLDFLKVVCQKLAARYEGKLDPNTKADPTATADGSPILGGIITDLNLFQEAADKAIKELADFRTVASDGEDLKKPAGDIH